MRWFFHRNVETPYMTSGVVVRPQSGCCCCGCFAFLPAFILVAALIVMLVALR